MEAILFMVSASSFMSRSTMNDLQGDLLCDSGLGGLDLLLQGYDRALLRNLLASLRPAADHYRGSVHILDNLFLVKKHQTIVIANRTFNH